MLARKHPKARCPYCASTLWYGLKSEASGWKVQYACAGREGCGREFNLGRIAGVDVNNEAEAYRRAERLGKTLL